MSFRGHAGWREVENLSRVRRAYSPCGCSIHRPPAIKRGHARNPSVEVETTGRQTDWTMEFSRSIANDRAARPADQAACRLWAGCPVIGTPAMALLGISDGRMMRIGDIWATNDRLQSGFTHRYVTSRTRVDGCSVRQMLHLSPHTGHLVLGCLLGAFFGLSWLDTSCPLPRSGLARFLPASPPGPWRSPVPRGASGDAGRSPPRCC